MHRRRWHLTQEELAFLFGYMDQSIIGRLERGERAITPEVAHTCELVFGVKPNELFPSLFESIEAEVVKRMGELRERLLQSRPTQQTLAKLELLHDALGRLSARSDCEEV